MDGFIRSWVAGIASAERAVPSLESAVATVAGLSPVWEGTVAQVDTSQRLQHTISWRDESSPNSKAKPPGVRGAEIWLFIGPTPPSDPGQAHFVALDTATPYLLVHDSADAGKLAHYLLRWVNSRSEAGPWSETVSATITG